MSDASVTHIKMRQDQLEHLLVQHKARQTKLEKIAGEALALRGTVERHEEELQQLRALLIAATEKLDGLEKTPRRRKS